MRKAKAIAATLILVAGSLIFAVLLAEIGLRLAGISYPYFLQPDPAKGWSLTPNVKGSFFGEVDNNVRINSRGLRDREHTTSKPPDTLRIAVLGDSYAEAFQVSPEEAFWTVLERTLEDRKCMGAFRNVETINFGVVSYGTAQELVVLRRDVWQYEPDIVLLAFYTQNDLADNTRALRPSNADSRPYFRRVNGLLVYDSSFIQSDVYQRWVRLFESPYYALHRRSRVVQLVRRATYAWRHRGRTRTPETLAEEDRNLSAPLYREPKDKAWKEAWEITETLILTMRSEVEAHGATFILVSLTNPIQVDVDEARRREFKRQHRIDDLFYPDKRLQSFAQRHGVSMLVLAPRMFSYAEAEKVHLHGFFGALGQGHWNKYGHEAAGEFIAQFLCRQSETAR